MITDGAILSCGCIKIRSDDVNITESMTAAEFKKLYGSGGGDKPPLEAEEQKTLFEVIEGAKLAYPELRMVFHVPNEGKRSRYTGGSLKAQGLQSGVPDVFLDVPRGGWHGLRIELKRIKDYSISAAQNEWVKNLNRYGYAAAVCFGWEEAWEMIMAYINNDSDTVQRYIEGSYSK